MEISEGLIVLWPVRGLVVIGLAWIMYLYFRLYGLSTTNQDWRPRLNFMFSAIFTGLVSSIFFGEFVYTVYTLFVATCVSLTYLLVRGKV